MWPLLAARVRPRTLDRYAEAIRPFICWATSVGLRLDTTVDLDRALLRFAHEAPGVSRSSFGTLMAAIVFFLPEVGPFPLAVQTRRGLLAYSPTQHKTPALWVFALALAWGCLQRGRPLVGAAVLVQFAGLLRPSELLGLRSVDAVLPEVAPPFAGGGSCSLILGALSSRGTKVNRLQSVTLDNVLAVGALRFLLSRAASPSVSLVGLTLAQYGRELQASAELCQFPLWGLRFTPHSLRAGAATQARMDGMSVQELMFRGRWAHESTLRVYLDVAMALATKTLRAAAPFAFLLSNPAHLSPLLLF